MGEETKGRKKKRTTFAMTRFNDSMCGVKEGVEGRRKPWKKVRKANTGRN